jgi:membrane protein
VMQNRRIVGIVGFVSLLWLSTRVFGSLRIALNIVFREDEKRAVLPAIGINLLMVLLAGILLLLSIILSFVASYLHGHPGPLPVAIGPTVQWILRYLLPFSLTYCMFCLIYKIIPHKRIHFGSALQAALFTSLLWELAKHLFAWYVLHLARYSIFYGSLSTAVIFVFWAYYS